MSILFYLTSYAPLPERKEPSRIFTMREFQELGYSYKDIKKRYNGPPIDWDNLSDDDEVFMRNLRVMRNFPLRWFSTTTQQRLPLIEKRAITIDSTFLIGIIFIRIWQIICMRHKFRWKSGSSGTTNKNKRSKWT